jgi:nitroreductase
MPPEHTLALDTLLTRRSVPALQLREPGPTQAQIDVAIAAALRAPDHGNLKPWRCVLVRGAARSRLSELLVARLQQREPDTPPKKLEKVRNQPLTAPLVIVAAARIQSGHKVPELEQLLSAGAATMNLINAFHAQGFGAIWLTGGNVYDPQVLQALGFAASEKCLGLVYVGSAQDSREAPAVRPVVNADAHVRDWSG